MSPVVITSSSAWDVVVMLHKIIFLLDRRAHILVRAELGLAYSQFMIIMALKHRGSISQRALADSSGLTPAAISRQVSGLVTKGLVKFQVNARNRRQHALSLTSRGDRAAIQAQLLLGRAFERLFRRLPGRQQTGLNAALRQLLDLICQEASAATRLPGDKSVRA
ncbi:MAG: MarR family transcriptional regulator [Patescibacteria group bacterium]